METKIFEIEDGVLKKYSGGETAVVPDGVTEIGEYSFLGNEMLKKVVLPQSVKRIGQQAFRGCTQLREMNLPEGLQRIARFAFCECGSIEKIYIPDSVIEIGNSAFRGCDMMTKARVPAGVERIGESAFSDCYSLENINIPDRIGSIRKRTFSDCQNLSCVEVPEGITELGDYAFECCSALTSIKLPGTLKKIGRHAFSGCSSLEDISVPSSVKSIGSSAFYDTPLIDAACEEFVIVGDGILVCCKSEEENVTLPMGVKVVGERAFAYMENIKSVSLPESVEQICDFAFEHCISLESISLPQSVTDIGSRAFVDCCSLMQVDLPDSLTHIGSDVFYGTGLLGSDMSEVVVYNGKYLIRCSVNAERFDVPDGITVIADGAFCGSSGLCEVTIPNSVRVIGNTAFRWLTELKNINIPDTVRFVGEEAFASSESLHTVMSTGERYIGEGAFSHSSKMTFKDGEDSFTVTLSDDCGRGSPLIDFALSPSAENFRKLDRESYRLPISVCYAHRFENCGEYLKNNIVKAVSYAVDSEDTRLLNKILGLELLSVQQLGECIEHAIDSGRHEQQVTLMRFKSEHFGEECVDKLIDDKFSL